jgi:hypothetical protein
VFEVGCAVAGAGTEPTVSGIAPSLPAQPPSIAATASVDKGEKRLLHLWFRNPENGRWKTLIKNAPAHQHTSDHHADCEL